MPQNPLFTPLRDIIEQRLQKAFSPVRLEVMDESHKHQGHAGSRPEGETHFHVQIAAPAFKEMSRLQRERAIHAVLEDLLKTRIHALSTQILPLDQHI